MWIRFWGAGQGFAIHLGTQLIAKGQVNGVLDVFNRTPFAPDENWLELLVILAGQLAIAVDNANLLNELRYSNAQLIGAYDATI